MRYLLKNLGLLYQKIYLLLFGLVIISVLGVGHYFGIFWYNSVLAWQYPVRGLDVSHHQGKIHWQQVADTKKYDFVYMKATEGHDFYDDEFATNWSDAKAVGIPAGAYHFFSMRSSGKEQAEYFMKYVPKEEAALAPVIDIEIALNHDPAKVRQELKSMAYILEDHYQKRPILYVMYSTYNQYIKDHFKDYEIWIRDVYKHPNLENRAWLIWQYNNRGRVNGIDTYVDVNAMRQSAKALQRESSPYRSPIVEEVHLKTNQLYQALDAHPPYYATEEEKISIPKQWQDTVSLAKQHLLTVKQQHQTEEELQLHYYLGELYRMGHNLDRPEAWKESANHFSAALSIDSKHFASLNGLATLLVNTGPQYAEDAEGLMTLALASATNERQKINVYQGLFFARVYQFRVKEGIEALDEGLKLDPENQRLLDLKKIYEQRISTDQETPEN